jgi:hypothetical protein
VADEEWNPVVDEEIEAGDGKWRGWGQVGGGWVKVVDCLALERFLVEGGEYPRLGREVIADNASNQGLLPHIQPSSMAMA